MKTMKLTMFAAAALMGMGIAQAAPAADRTGCEPAAGNDTQGAWGGEPLEEPRSIAELGPEVESAPWPLNEHTEGPRWIDELGPEAEPGPWPKIEITEEPRAIAELWPERPGRDREPSRLAGETGQVSC